jgi:hypothetical protein
MNPVHNLLRFSKINFNIIFSPIPRPAKRRLHFSYSDATLRKFLTCVVLFPSALKASVSRLTVPKVQLDYTPYNFQENTLQREYYKNRKQYALKHNNFRYICGFPLYFIIKYFLLSARMLQWFSVYILGNREIFLDKAGFRLIQVPFYTSVIVIYLRLVTVRTLYNRPTSFSCKTGSSNLDWVET